MTENRRPIAARSSRLAQQFAAFLARSRVTPNQISTASVGAALVGAGGLLLGGVSGFLVAVLGIQLRLLCNLFDGMVAIEGGKKSAVGALYNEFPDRIADSVLLIALGYAAQVSWLGWLGALLAALTAYVRVFGGSLGQVQDFQGPMAKQHRMALLTVACLGAAVLPPVALPLLQSAAVLIAVGSAWTCVTRTRSIASKLAEGG